MNIYTLILHVLLNYRKTDNGVLRDEKGREINASTIT